MALPDTRFEFKKKSWEADDNQTPLVRYENFSGVKDILALMHELGHLNNKELGERARKAYHDFAAEEKKDIGHGHPESWLMALRKKRNAYLAMEQAAWDYAVNTIKNIEARYKINIMNRLGTEENLHKFIDSQIDTYRQDYIDLLDESYVRNDRELDEYFKFNLDQPSWRERQEKQEKILKSRQEPAKQEWEKRRQASL